MKSIKTKILSIYAFLIFLIFFTAFISIVNLYDLNKSVDGLIAANYRSIVAARNMLDAVERQDSYILIFIQEEGINTVDNFYKYQDTFLEWYEKAENNVTEDEEKEILHKLDVQYKQFKEKFFSLRQLKENQDKEKVAGFYADEISSSLLGVKELCNKLLLVNERAMFESKDKAKEKSVREIHLISFLSGLSIALGLIIAIRYTGKIVEPLNVLLLGIKSIKEGDLSQEIQLVSKDEFGQLSKEFNNMSRRLSVYEKGNVKNLISEKNKSIAIVKNIMDPIVVVDNNCSITLVNKSAENLFDISEDNALGKSFLEAIDDVVIYNKIKNTITKATEDEMKESKKFNKVLSFYKEDKMAYYILRVTSIFDNEENSIGAVMILQDITGFKEIEQMKSDFIATISHEIRTPLTSIIMGTELLINKSIGNLNSNQEEIITAMDEDSKQLLNLVNDLLDFSRLESGKIKMNYEQTDINELVKSAVKSFMNLSEGNGVKLYSSLAKEKVVINIDINKILCVINNLIANALKFTSFNDEIKVYSSIEGRFIKISVEDTGMGIPEEYLEIIFEKYVQVDSMVQEGVGSGLGLAIAKEFVKKHGGDIWAESTLNHGSKFIFTLPI